MIITHNDLKLLVDNFRAIDDGENFLRYTLDFYGVKKFTELGDKLQEVFLYLSGVLFNIKRV